jgi:hypothetical protein
MHKELLHMHQSAKQNVMNRPEQQLLSCSLKESLDMIASAFTGSELITDYSSMNEQLKQKPRKTYR